MHAQGIVVRSRGNTGPRLRSAKTIGQKKRDRMQEIQMYSTTTKNHRPTKNASGPPNKYLRDAHRLNLYTNRTLSTRFVQKIRSPLRINEIFDDNAGIRAQRQLFDHGEPSETANRMRLIARWKKDHLFVDLVIILSLS